MEEGFTTYRFPGNENSNKTLTCVPEVYEDALIYNPHLLPSKVGLSLNPL